MALNQKTQQALMDMLKVKQPESIAAPLSPYEAIQMERGLLSTDPVVSKLQKVGRGVQSLLEPETPIDYLSMALPVGKPVGKTIKKGVEVAKKTIKSSKKSKPLYQKMSPGELDASERFLQYHMLEPYKGFGPKRDTYEILKDRIVIYWGAGDKMFPNKVSQKTYKNPTLENLQKDFGY